MYSIITMFFISGLSLLLPLEYRADTKVFILPKSVKTIDTYTTIKSTENLGDNLTKLIQTSSFFDLVALAGKSSIDIAYFSQNSKTRAHEWERIVKASVVPGTGLMEISIYHKDKSQARAILQAVANILAEHGQSYTGFDVEIRQVDAIYVTDFPVRPNVLANAIIGFILGGLITSLYIIFEEERAWKL